jgi:hypothetical protein
VSLAVTASFVATGCAPTWLSGPADRPGAPLAVTGRKAPPSASFGTIALNVRGLQQALRSIAAFKGVIGSTAKLVIVVRKSSDLSIPTDVAGKAAAYTATIGSSGNVTVNIPALPSTATSTTTLTTTGDPYVFQIRAFDSAQTVPLNGDTLHVDTADALFGSDLTVLTDAQMKASGEVKAHVVAGLPVVVTVDTFAHFGANLDNAASVTAVTLTGATTVDEPGVSAIWRARITNLAVAKLGPAGGAKAAFTVSGTPRAGDTIEINATDKQDVAKTYRLIYPVVTGESAAAVAASIAAAITAQGAALAPATAAFGAAYSGSISGATVTITANVASAAFNYAVASAVATAPTVKDYSIAESARTAGNGVAIVYTSTQTLSVAGGVVQAGDTITVSFTTEGATPITSRKPATETDTLPTTIATALAAALELADGTNLYNFTSSGAAITITANTSALTSNIAVGGVTVSEARPTAAAVSAATVTNLLKRFRVLLQFPQGISDNTKWTITDKDGTVVKTTSGASVTALVGTKLFAGVSPTPSNANTQHWVDIDDETTGRRFPDGNLDVTVTAVPGNFTNIQIIDMVTGTGAPSSTIIQ